MSKPASRPARWYSAIAKARAAEGEIEAAKAKLAEAIGDLRGLKEEYEEWKDNMPEGLQSSPVYEKLEAICDLDLDPDEDDVSAMLEVVEEAENADLPRGFGKD